MHSQSLCINPRETNKLGKQLGRQRLEGTLPLLSPRPLQVVCRFTIMSATEQMLAFSLTPKKSVPGGSRFFCAVVFVV